MYDDEHPGLVASMIQEFLKKDGESRALVAVAMRDHKTTEILFVFKEMMIGMGFCLIGEGEAVSRDDWCEDDEISEVCRWGVWAWAANSE